jgi:hypothetical protein
MLIIIYSKINNYFRMTNIMFTNTYSVKEKIIMINVFILTLNSLNLQLGIFYYVN